MATTPSIRLLKTSPYKGGVRTWSNRYHFNGGTPADDTHWHTLMDNVVDAEKATLSADTTIVEAIGYGAGSDVPVSTKTYTTAGTLVPGSGVVDAPLECAALVRFSTNARSVKNHPIYLFSYVHRVIVRSGIANAETLGPNQKTALQTYGGAWITGFSDGSITAVRASPNGAAATGVTVESYVTHRDFPYTPSL